MLVGCIPNSADFSHPADRRRYLFYFNKAGVNYEYAVYKKHYDIVHIAINADLGMWCNYRHAQLRAGKKVRVIFDLSDFYFGADTINDFARSLYHFAVGRSSTVSISYKATLLRMVAGSDIVLCGSIEQKKFLDQYHSNVVVVRDYFGSEGLTVKKQYGLSRRGELNVFWEGFAHGNKRIFEMLRNILNNVANYKVRVHIVTDPTYCRVGSKHLCQPTYSVLKKVFIHSNVSFHLYDWNSVTFSAIASACDLALIPLPDEPQLWNKPENKLLLLWTVGLPTITSSTPAYSRVMRSVGGGYTCGNIEEWGRQIEELASSEELRIKHMTAALGYLNEHCADDVLLRAWAEIFRIERTN